MSTTSIRLIMTCAVVALLGAACTSDAIGGDTGSDLVIERRLGYAVVVEETVDALTIGFSADRDSTSGEAHDVSQSLWRSGPEGAWSAPPATCLGRGQRVELGIAEIQDEARPGLLFEKVLWLSCLDPDQPE